MTDVPGDLDRPAGPRSGWVNRLAASRRFQTLAMRVPLLRRIARAEGEALFGLISGFVQSQILMALVELRILHHLDAAPLTPVQMAGRSGLDLRAMELLLQAGAAQRLLKRHRHGRFGLARRGAALLGVPGLEAMVRHHRVFYDDLADPVALLRRQTEPGLARFWPYVHGPEGASDLSVAQTYSTLMADSQALVAEDTLRLVDFGGIRHLMDVGGGSGAFLAAIGAAHPTLRMTLVDLPAVVPAATERFARAGLTGRVSVVPGSFSDPLPLGADAISLVRVLYDHADETVAALLSAVFTALPPGGRLIVSEPMSGGDRPDALTDTYFALYTFAMGTGRTRSSDLIATTLARAGFSEIDQHPGFRPYVTSVVTARKPGVSGK